MLDGLSKYTTMRFLLSQMQGESSAEDIFTLRDCPLRALEGRLTDPSDMVSSLVYTEWRQSARVQNLVDIRVVSSPFTKTNRILARV